MLQRHYDLHLLLSPNDVQWVADGQRCQPDMAHRQQFFRDSEQWLTQHGQPYEVVEGDWATRETCALEAVEQVLRG